MAEISKIVKQRLQTNAKLADHPEPNLLSAFVERSLGQREQSEVLQHLSQCMNCREIVSLSGAQPNLADAVSLTPARAAWLSWPALRWGAAMACIIVVGAAITVHQRHESVQHPATQASMSSPSKSTQAITDKAALPQSPNLNPAPVQAAKQRISRSNSGNHRAADSMPVEMADARTASPFSEVVPGRAKDAVPRAKLNPQLEDQPQIRWQAARSSRMTSRLKVLHHAGL